MTDIKALDAAAFIFAARDSYDRGADRFAPGYAQYGDLLEAAEVMARAKLAPDGAAVERVGSALVGLLALYEDDEGCTELPQVVEARAALAAMGEG